MKKKLPQALLNKQDSKRSATSATVTDAIIELESQGYHVRIKDIMFVTGLSRAVFAKPHVRKVLVEHGVVNPSDKSTTTSDSISRNIRRILVEKDGYIQRLIFVNEQLMNEIQLLRGQVHLLSHKSMLEDPEPF